MPSYLCLKLLSLIGINLPPKVPIAVVLLPWEYFSRIQHPALQRGKELVVKQAICSPAGSEYKLRTPGNGHKLSPASAFSL